MRVSRSLAFLNRVQRSRQMVEWLKSDLRPSSERTQDAAEHQLDDRQAPAGLERRVEAGVERRRVGQVVIDAAHEDPVATGRRQIRFVFTGFDHGDVAESGDSDRFPDVVATPWRTLRREYLPGLTDHRCDLDAQPPSPAPMSATVSLGRMSSRRARRSTSVSLSHPANMRTATTRTAPPSQRATGFHRSIEHLRCDSDLQSSDESGTMRPEREAEDIQGDPGDAGEPQSRVGDQTAEPMHQAEGTRHHPGEPAPATGRSGQPRPGAIPCW